MVCQHALLFEFQDNAEVQGQRSAPFLENHWNWSAATRNGPKVPEARERSSKKMETAPISNILISCTVGRLSIMAASQTWIPAKWFQQNNGNGKNWLGDLFFLVLLTIASIWGPFFGDVFFWFLASVASPDLWLVWLLWLLCLKPKPTRNNP